MRVNWLLKQLQLRRISRGETIPPHPTLGESIGMAADVAHGSYTDFSPARK